MATKAEPKSTTATLLLTIGAVLWIAIFSNVGVNNTFFELRIGRYWDDFVAQKAAAYSQEEIKRQRYGGPYIASQMIRDYFVTRQIKDPLILMEPNAYLQSRYNFKMPEPIIFYYFTGLRSLWMNAENVDEATHIVYFTKKGLRIEPIKNPEELREILARYQQYEPAL